MRFIGWVALVAALALFAAALHYITPKTGEMVDATVVSFGSRPTDEGDRPLMTVRFDDGTVRQLMVGGEAIKNCRAGSRVQIFNGNIMKVGLRGCAR